MHTALASYHAGAVGFFYLLLKEVSDGEFVEQQFIGHRILRVAVHCFRRTETVQSDCVVVVVGVSPDLDSRGGCFRNCTGRVWHCWIRCVLRVGVGKKEVGTL